LQKKLAREITTLVHSKEEYEMALKASQILFGKSTSDELAQLNEKTFLAVFDGVPVAEINSNDLKNGIDIISLLTDKTGFFKSKGELRRTIKGNGLSINKEKFTDENGIINEKYLMNNTYILAQKGKRNYFLIKVKP